MFALAFLIAALVLFIIAGVGIPSGRINLIAIGLACLAASMLSGRMAG